MEKSQEVGFRLLQGWRLAYRACEVDECCQTILGDPQLAPMRIVRSMLDKLPRVDAKAIMDMRPDDYATEPDKCYKARRSTSGTTGNESLLRGFQRKRAFGTLATSVA